MTKEEIIDNIARLNSETWRDREETRTEIGKLLAELKKALEQQPSDDCVSRQAIDHLCFEYLRPNTDDNIAFYEHFCDLPPVTPTQSTCKDCKHNRPNSYARTMFSCKRGNRFKLRDCEDFYCADFERREE